MIETEFDAFAQCHARIVGANECNRMKCSCSCVIDIASEQRACMGIMHGVPLAAMQYDNLLIENN